MEKLTITKIARFDKDKAGNPLIAKSGKNAGKPYTSVRVQTKEYGERWLSTWGNKTTDAWKEGDEIEVGVEENGEYLNLIVPKKEDVALSAVKELEIKINSLTTHLTDLSRRVKKLESTDELDIPFE